MISECELCQNKRNYLSQLDEQSSQCHCHSFIRAWEEFGWL